MSKSQSEMCVNLDLAIAELLLAGKSADLAQRKMHRIIKQVRRKYPKMGKGIARLERTLNGLPAVVDHLQNASKLLSVLEKLQELEESRASGITDELIPVIAPGVGALPVVAGTTSAPDTLADTDR